MKNNSKIVVLSLVLALLTLGVGYAAIPPLTLNITGSAGAKADPTNFKVEFMGTPVSSDSKKVTAAISATDKKEATLTVTGLTAKGDSVSATYTIKNYSEDLSANLKASVTKNSNDEYFEVTPTLAKTSLVKGGDTTVTVTVTLKKTPVTSDVTSDIAVKVTADPVQPTV